MGLLTPKVYHSSFALLSLPSLICQPLSKGDSSCLLSDDDSEKKPSANSVVQSHGLTRHVRDSSGAQAHLEFPCPQQTQLGCMFSCVAVNHFCLWSL